MAKPIQPGPKLLVFQAGLYTCSLDIEQQIQNSLEFRAYQSPLLKLVLVSPQKLPGVELNCNYLINSINHNPRLQMLKAKLNNIPSHDRIIPKLGPTLAPMNINKINSGMTPQLNPYPPLLHSPVTKNSPPIHENKFNRFDSKKKIQDTLIDWNEQSVREGAQWKRGNGPICSLYKKGYVFEPEITPVKVNHDLNRTLQPMKPPSIKNRDQKHITFVLSDSSDSPDKQENSLSWYENSTSKNFESPMKKNTSVSEAENTNDQQLSNSLTKSSDSIQSNISLERDTSKVLGFSDSDDDYF